MGSTPQQPQPDTSFDQLIRQVESLRGMIQKRTDPDRQNLAGIPSERIPSAENLLHYLALRSKDIRPLQDGLTRTGLSTLGRVEAHVLASINALLRNLRLVSGRQQVEADCHDIYAAFDASEDCLEQNTTSLLGERPEKRRVYIIVTMPAEAADDYLMVHQLLKSGMNCMRINCAHDSPETWSRMIETLRNAVRATGRSCRVLMDLGGPKLRLGPMRSNPSVLKIRPLRASNGNVLRPARIWLAPAETVFSEIPAADASLILDPDWLAGLKAGDRIEFRDVRGTQKLAYQGSVF